MTMNPGNVHASMAAAAAVAGPEEMAETRPAARQLGRKRTADAAHREHTGAGAGAGAGAVVVRKRARVNRAMGNYYMALAQEMEFASGNWLLPGPISLQMICAIASSIVGIVSFAMNPGHHAVMLLGMEKFHPMTIARNAVYGLLCARFNTRLPNGSETGMLRDVVFCARERAQELIVDRRRGATISIDDVSNAAQVAGLAMYAERVDTRTSKQQREAKDREDATAATAAKEPIIKAKTSVGWTRGAAHANAKVYKPGDFRGYRVHSTDWSPPLNSYVMQIVVTYAIRRAESAPLNLGFEFVDHKDRNLMRVRTAVPADAVGGGVASACGRPRCTRPAIGGPRTRPLCVECYGITDDLRCTQDSPELVADISKRVFVAYYNMFIAPSIERRRLHMRFLVGEFKGKDGAALPSDIRDLILAHARE